jgi:hypothetical protein
MSAPPGRDRGLSHLIQYIEKHGEAHRQGMALCLLVVKPQLATDHVVHGWPPPVGRLRAIQLMPPDKGHREHS